MLVDIFEFSETAFFSVLSIPFSEDFLVKLMRHFPFVFGDLPIFHTGPVQKRQLYFRELKFDLFIYDLDHLLLVRRLSFLLLSKLTLEVLQSFLGDFADKEIVGVWVTKSIVLLFVVVDSPVKVKSLLLLVEFLPAVMFLHM